MLMHVQQIILLLLKIQFFGAVGSTTEFDDGETEG
jgi:hypothetical protein